MQSIPDTVAKYQTTPIFDEESVSEAFLVPHCTKRGVWAKIVVVEGQLRYFLEDPPEERQLVPGQPAIVAPRERHCIQPVGKVRFYIEFYR